jgi:hypothetical protein
LAVEVSTTFRLSGRKRQEKIGKKGKVKGVRGEEGGIVVSRSLLSVVYAPRGGTKKSGLQGTREKEESGGRYMTTTNGKIGKM